MDKQNKKERQRTARLAFKIAMTAIVCVLLFFGVAFTVHETNYQYSPELDRKVSRVYKLIYYPTDSNARIPIGGTYQTEKACKEKGLEVINEHNDDTTGAAFYCGTKCISRWDGLEPRDCIDGTMFTKHKDGWSQEPYSGYCSDGPPSRCDQ